MYFKLDVAARIQPDHDKTNNIKIKFTEEQTNLISISKHANEGRPANGGLNKKEILIQQLANPDDRAFLSDFGAFTCVALFLGAALQGNAFLSMMFKLCGKTLLRMGLTEINEHSFIGEMNQAKTITVFVPGIQNERLLERRVKAEFEIEETVRKAFTVIWSGRNPGTDDVEIPDEAESMRIFHSQLERRGKKRTDIDHKNTLKEDQSTNTIENINNTFSVGRYINKGNQNQTLVIVSSTFHLIRLAKRIIQMIDQNEYNIKYYMESVFFVGAEKLGDVDPGQLWASIKERELIKLMMFDIYNQNMT